jgi:hypothetical protein
MRRLSSWHGITTIRGLTRHTLKNIEASTGNMWNYRWFLGNFIRKYSIRSARQVGQGYFGKRLQLLTVYGHPPPVRNQLFSCGPLVDLLRRTSARAARPMAAASPTTQCQWGRLSYMRLSSDYRATKLLSRVTGGISDRAMPTRSTCWPRESSISDR